MEVLQILQELDRSEELNLSIRELHSRDSKIDLVLEINKEKVLIKTKYEVRPSQVGQLHDQAKLYQKEIFLVASNYITPSAKRLLKEYRISYLDSGGNIHLKLNKGLIFIEGKHVKPPSEKYKNRAFTKVGAKLIYTLLREPSYADLNYRSLSEISTCSLGSISKIMDHLKKEQFIINLPNKKIKLIQQDKLMAKWIETLKNQLLPAMLIGKYNFPRSKKWHEINLKQKQGYRWGGEVAASILTKNLRPQEYTIYTSKKSSELMKDFKLTPDKNGELSVYREFWNDGSTQTKSATVDPVLIYAELMASSDSRNIEAANDIKEMFLGEHL